MTRYKISMKMGFKNIFYSSAIACSFLNIGVNFTQRVNYHSLSFAFNIICTLCQATGIDLFYLHNYAVLIDQRNFFIMVLKEYGFYHRTFSYRDDNKGY